MLKNELSMVICAYGNSHYLEEAVCSVLKQTVPVRVLLATSTPSESVENIVKKYNLEYFVNPVKGGGIAADWEFAVSCAQTEYVTIVHQDDIYFPEYAQRILESFRRAPDSVIVFTDYCDLIDGTYLENRTYLWIKRILLWLYYLKHSWRLRSFKRSALCFGNAICCPSVSYNIGKTGNLKFDHSYSVNLDWAKWLELSSGKGAFTFVPCCLMSHRIDPSTETSSAIQDNRRYDEDFRIFASIWGRFIAKILMKFYAKSYKMAEVEK